MESGFDLDGNLFGVCKPVRFAWFGVPSFHVSVRFLRARFRWDGFPGPKVLIHAVILSDASDPAKS